MKLSERIAAAVLRFFGPVEIVVGYFCLHCDDVHETGTRCPRAMRGSCLDCQRVQNLDKFGNCKCGSRSVINRELRWPNERYVGGGERKE